jgi:hypothetical protein
MEVLMKPISMRGLAILMLGGCAVLGGCSVEGPASNGDCSMNAALSCDSAILAGNADAGVSLGLVGYSCTGSARPDQDPKFVAGIPQGMICADQGQAADGTYGFCCTPPDAPVSCAFDPTSTLSAQQDPNGKYACPEPGSYRFQCYGSDRPEALNPDLTCGNGVRDGNLVNYCCAAAGRPVGCTEAKGGACTGGLVGWRCPPDTLPRGEDFGMSESRADYYYFVCAVPGPPATDNFSTYCCFTPSPLLPGGSCVTSTKIQGQISDCGMGRFGFACYGRDTPEDDYEQIHCTEAPIDGVDDHGTAAKLYCCDYRKPNGIACSIGDECQSHDCTEGYCCALSSCQSCYSCAVPGVPGTCRLVPAGMPDPTGTCANGCDGTGGCM